MSGIAERLGRAVKWDPAGEKVVDGSIADPMSALFEAVSGFTTTGSTVVSQIARMRCAFSRRASSACRRWAIGQSG